MFRFSIALLATVFSAQQLPHPTPNGYDLPNGWKITPLGSAVQTEDMVLGLSMAPDHKSVVALHSGFNPHGLVVVDTTSKEALQRIPLKSAWLGLAWHPNGKSLYVSGGNANGRIPTRAPIYIFDYANGRLSDKPAGTLEETIDSSSAGTVNGVVTVATATNTVTLAKASAAGSGGTLRFACQKWHSYTR